MQKTTSAARLAANRRNAQNSTGQGLVRGFLRDYTFSFARAWRIPAGVK